jgi:hypothetical protein
MKAKRTALEIAADEFRTGRPKAPRSVKRACCILLRVTRGELAALKTESRRAGVSVPEVLMRPWRAQP